MNSKPLSSLNHFAVPVAIWFLPGGCVRRNAGGAKATTTNAGTGLPSRIARHERTSLAAEGVCDRDLMSRGAAPHAGGTLVGGLVVGLAFAIDRRATADTTP